MGFWRKISHNFLFAILLCCLNVNASASEKTILHLSTGSSTDTPRSIVQTKDGNNLLLGGDDRAIRDLDTQNLTEKRSYFGYLGKGGSGSITAMALSPDDKWLAVGVFFPHQTEQGEIRSYLRIYDYQKKKLVGLLKGHKQVIHSLSFSAGGTMLISGEALRQNPIAIIWNVEDWSIRHKLSGHVDQIFGAAFTPDNKIAING